MMEKTPDLFGRLLISCFGRWFPGFASAYQQQKIAGKLNWLLYFLLALIVANTLVVLVSLYIMYDRNTTLSALDGFVEQVGQVEISQLRFRLAHKREDALNARYALNRAQSILATLPKDVFKDSGSGKSVKMLMATLDDRFNEYLLYQEQASALENRMRKMGDELLAGVQQLRAGKAGDPLNDLRAQLVHSVLDATIIQQEFALERDMSLSVRMAQAVISIVDSSSRLRAQSQSVEALIEAYNIGQQALLLDRAFVKLRDYTKMKMVNEKGMSTAAKDILFRAYEAATRQRASISALLLVIVVSVLSASLLVIIIGFLSGRRFVHKLTSSLSQLMQMSRRISRGDYSQHSLPPSPDEFGELATSFNEMAHTVENQIQALRESEQRVSQRTAELEIANESLAQSKAAAEALNELLEAKVRERTKALEEANVKLSELTVTDALTGLSNRRRFDQVISEEWMRASRTGQSLAILMIDVDHFKAYNDHYGHPAGDECLRKVAGVLQANARRASDLVARYGGEEFVVVAADLDIQAAKELAETLRSSVEALGMSHEFSAAAKVVTISIGVSVTTPDVNTPPESLLRMADAAMYYAKDGGRNRVAAWGSSAPEKV